MIRWMSRGAKRDGQAQAPLLIDCGEKLPPQP